MFENLKNLLFSKFEFILNFGNSHQVDYVDYFCY